MTESYLLDGRAIIPGDMTVSKTRDNRRVELMGALQGEVMVFQPTSVHQISLGGMQVETVFPLQVDSLHEFRLTLAGSSIVIKGRVAHSRISEVDQDVLTYRSGVEFVEPSEHAATVIAKFMDTMAESPI